MSGHTEAPLLAGAAPAEAGTAVVLLHGRGATPESLLSLLEVLPTEGVAYLLPRASRNTWYPHSFLAPLAKNQPYLDDALAAVDRSLHRLLDTGFSPARCLLGGFSQGACLALEYAARNPRPYGGLFGWSGGLIGPEGTDRRYSGSLAGVPVFLGCSDVDPHIPAPRVELTQAVLQEMGASVDARLYPGMPHMVNREEIEVVAGMIQSPGPRWAKQS